MIGKNPMKLHYPSDRQRLRDVPWVFPEDHNIWDLQGGFRVLSGEQYKNWYLNEKNIFRSHSLYITHLVLFLQEEQIFRSSERKCSRGVCGAQLRDVERTKWWDVLGTFFGRRSYMFFKFNSQTFWNFFDRLLKSFYRLYGDCIVVKK